MSDPPLPDAGGYPVPAGAHRAEEVARRSRFLTLLAHAPDSDAAHAFVEGARQEFPDATHHCWAFVAGPPGSTTSVGMSDDGEPHGTAGRPMLTALLHSGVGEVVAVVVRWYGGTNLGTGGLSRAYGGGVKRALEELPTTLRIEREELAVVVGYAHVDPLRRLAEEVGATVLEETYGADVRYRLAVPGVRVEAFLGRLADVTAGDARVERDV